MERKGQLLISGQWDVGEPVAEFLSSLTASSQVGVTTFGDAFAVGWARTAAGAVRRSPKAERREMAAALTGEDEEDIDILVLLAEALGVRRDGRDAWLKPWETSNMTPRRIKGTMPPHAPLRKAFVPCIIQCRLHSRASASMPRALGDFVGIPTPLFQRLYLVCLLDSSGATLELNIYLINKYY